jgi:hypothetical protein
MQKIYNYAEAPTTYASFQQLFLQKSLKNKNYSKIKTTTLYPGGIRSPDP